MNRPEIEGQSVDVERDSCGVGFIADLEGRRRHDLLEMGLTALSAMRHRGAVSADAETGDGAGVLFQLPAGFFRRELARRGIHLAPKGRIAVGMVFLPTSPEDREASKRTIEAVIARTGETRTSHQVSAVRSADGGSAPRTVRIPLQCLGWRQVPVNAEVLGEEARAACPVIEQVIIAPTSPCSGDALERTLFLVRKEIERRLSDAGLPAYIASLSHRTIVYKALLVSPISEDSTRIFSGRTSARGLRSFMVATAPTRDRAGGWLSRFAYWRIMERSTPSRGIADGSRRGQRCSPPFGEMKRSGSCPSSTKERATRPT